MANSTAGQSSRLLVIDNINTVTGFERSRNAAHKHSLAGVEWHRGIENEVGVTQAPWSDLHLRQTRGKVLTADWFSHYWFVFDCRARDAQIEFVVLLNARVDQRLNGRFVLKEQECIACARVWSLRSLEIIRADLWVGSKTCSRLCAASRPPEGRSVGNWP